MQDHARRYRLRSLMYERIRQSAVSIGDLTAHLDDVLEQDEELSRALIPEVWRVHRKEAEGVKHAEERKRFLRIQILRELSIGIKQRIGLEPWGRLQVEYSGLTTDLSFIQHWSSQLGLTAEDLVQGVSSLLDHARRGNILLDREGNLFSRLWREGDFEIQRGYMPILLGVPKGLKLTRETADKAGRVQQWLSEKGNNTVASQAARNWGVPKDQMEAFFHDLWKCLTEETKLLAPSVFKGQRNRLLAGCEGVYQIDADKLRLVSSKGVYRCSTCRRAHPRPTPHAACMTWLCKGTVAFEPESSDDYDLQVLDEQFAMLRPREHSAQVPNKDRETIERIFKGDNELLNTLVCTPTLEMGVDIGSLDSVLMRNIPPLPANYWQRAGRAGRRHRMAVNLSYARPASHDRAYFKDPLRLLEGQIEPPRLNLRNTLMVGKHVRAAVLTVLHQLARPQSPLSKAAQTEISDVLKECLPTRVNHYLFEEGFVRAAPLNVNAIADLIDKYSTQLYEHIKTAFADSWPAADNDAVSEAALKEHITGMGAALSEVIRRLWRRLQWALVQIKRLNQLRMQKGALDPEEDALFRRCDRLVKTLKGRNPRKRSQAEGYDDTNTYGVLAAEGFLPGYGLDIGSIRGTAQIPRGVSWLNDFDLPRPPSVALREYVPGNLIYANGQRFVPRFFHLELEEPTHFQVDVAREAITEIGTGRVAAALTTSSLQAVPICDLDLAHQSNISDDEDNRFQLPVTILGYEQERHNGGIAFTWGTQSVQLRRSVHLRLVNVGAASLVRNNQLGYHICLVCGHSRSPFNSPADIQKFSEDHHQRCGKKIVPTGVYANIVADALSIQDCEGQKVAYSVLESIRYGASNILNMELDDLQVLTVAHAGSDRVDALLYDPMPGGSGLLEQLINRWPEVINSGLQVLHGCQSKCETACIDCLFTFRNAYYHRYLDRHLAIEKLTQWQDTLAKSHDIPSKLPTKQEDADHRPVNHPEALLQEMLKRSGFPDPKAQHSIDLGKPLGTTVPDFFFEDPDERTEGICIYLDGMSKTLHGNPATQQRDRAIRDELRGRDFEVFEIAVGDLIDRAKMSKTFFRLGRVLLGKARATDIRDRTDWFEATQQTQQPTSESNASSTSSADELSEFITLLSQPWQELLTALRDVEEIVLEEGNDISNDEGVIGQYLVCLRKGDHALFLLEDTGSEVSQTIAALHQQGQQAMVVDPTSTDILTKVLVELETVL